PVEAHFSLWVLIAAAGALLLVRLALNIVGARLSAAATSSVLADTRKNFVSLYLRAGWSLQSAEREGRLQELLTTYASNAANTATSLSQGLVGLFNLFAFLVTALVINVVAAIGVRAGVAAIALALRLFRSAVRRRSR